MKKYLKNENNLINKNIRNIGDKTNKFGTKLSGYRENAFSRFPLLFVLMSSFGLVATFYGFEKVIDQIGFFDSNPLMILFVGVVVLIITGSLYKKLN